MSKKKTPNEYEIAYKKLILLEPKWKQSVIVDETDGRLANDFMKKVIAEVEGETETKKETI